jgi:hypothetical protein
MEISRRHHYIPRFLIKNFSDSNEKLWVYNKQEKRIVSTQQSPKAIFFEWERNLFEVNGEPVDNIEKMYGEVDDLLAKTLEKILSSHTMTGREQTLIIFLVSLMKWRIPKIDSRFHELAKDVPIEKLGLKIRPVDPNAKVNDKDLNEIMDMEIVKEVKRLLLPIQPLINEGILDEIHKNCFIVSDDKFPALLGDCPIIESPNSSYKTLEDFIFPLSSNETFICKKGAEKYISSPFFHVQKDLTIFHLSEKYVACKSREQLENIVKIYSQLEEKKQTHLLAKYAFEFIK